MKVDIIEDFFNAKKNQIGLSIEDVVKIKAILSFIAKIDIQNNSISRSDNSISFNMVLNNKIKSILIITIMLLGGINEDIEHNVIYTLFEGDTLIVSNIKPIQNVVNGIKEYMSNN